jgi:hypothetical protein
LELCHPRIPALVVLKIQLAVVTGRATSNCVNLASQRLNGRHDVSHEATVQDRSACSILGRCTIAKSWSSLVSVVEWEGGVDKDLTAIRAVLLVAKHVAPPVWRSRRVWSEGKGLWFPRYRKYDSSMLGATSRLQLVSPKIPSSDSPAQLRR